MGVCDLLAATRLAMAVKDKMGDMLYKIFTLVGWLLVPRDEER
jgi:hypothetical protein